MHWKFPDNSMKLLCRHCPHPLPGHLDTGGHFVEGCHFDWDEGPPEKEGCKCPGFGIKFERSFEE
jgi:hypothetical protein